MRAPWTIAGRHRIHALHWWTRRFAGHELDGGYLDGINAGELIYVWGPDRHGGAEVVTGLEVVIDYRGPLAYSPRCVVTIPALACPEGWPLELLALFRGSAHASEDLWLVIQPTTGQATIEGLLLDGVEK